MTRKVLSVDIGGSKLLVGIVDETGKVLCRRKRAFHDPDREQVTQFIVEESRAVLADSSWKDDPSEEVQAIGVSIPGLADSEKGLWVYAPFSKIADLDMRGLLQDAFGKPVYLDNDGNVCAVGEKRFGCAKEVDDFLWITVSNGVGAGLMLNGRLYDGAFKGAGELGHIKVVENGVVCPCGAKGCLEAYAAGPGISRRYQEKTGAETRLTAQEIAELARRNDAAALEVFREEGYYLGKAIASAVTLLNLPLAVIGGGVAGAFDLFEPELQKTLREQMFLSANKNFKVLPTALGYEASLIGAGALAFQGLEKRS